MHLMPERAKGTHCSEHSSIEYDASRSLKAISMKLMLEDQHRPKQHGKIWVLIALN